jgi:hypothetical protein
MNARYIAIFALVISFQAYAEEGDLMIGGLGDKPSQQAIGLPLSFISSDSEGFNAYKLGGKYLPLYQHGDNYTGLSYQYNKYTQNQWSAEANQYGITSKSLDPKTALGYIVNINANNLNGYTLLTTDSYFGFNATDSTRIEAFISREWVETQNSLNNGIYYTLGGISIEQRIVEGLSGVITGGNMYFSDSNTRPFIRANLIYDILPEYGINVQARYRQYHDTNTNVVNNYFNPNNYNEGMLAIGMRRYIQGWMLAGTLGLGMQRVNSDPSTGTQLLEFNATSPYVGPAFFRTRLGYRKSAGFQGPDYSYTYFMEELIIPF